MKQALVIIRLNGDGRSDFPLATLMKNISRMDSDKIMVIGNPDAAMSAAIDGWKNSRIEVEVRPILTVAEDEKLGLTYSVRMFMPANA